MKDKSDNNVNSFSHFSHTHAHVVIHIGCMQICAYHAAAAAACAAADAAISIVDF